MVNYAQMRPPPQPPEESRRLEALLSLSLLDTPPDARFDAITTAAAGLLGMPIALISLVDASRQWFKSRHGLAVSETPREVSFCGHAILSDQTLIVEDAFEDPRFADNPLVIGQPHIRFYAGRPLVAPDGSRVGTLCVIDREPRKLATQERVALAVLGAWAEAEIARAATQQRCLQFTGNLLSLIQDAALLVDENGAISTANSAALALLQVSREAICGSSMGALVLEPEDFADRLARLSSAARGAETFDTAACVRRGQGEALPVVLRCVGERVGDKTVTVVIVGPRTG